jgi:iron complex outermembrane receptor protein
MNLKKMSWIIGAIFATPAIASYAQTEESPPSASAPVLATQAAAPPPAAMASQDSSVVMVTGMRASLRNAMNIKKNATEIVDSIAAEDIGKLPDANIAEALQRVPGIQIQRSDGEGTSVAIRGLSQVKTLLDGREIYSDAGRDLSLENIPTELLGGIDVYKNPSASMIEGGLGGIINLKSRRPFDFKGFSASGTVRATENSTYKSVTPQISGLVSNRWNTSIGQVGAMLNLTYDKSDVRKDTIGVEPFNNRCDLVDYDHNGILSKTNNCALDQGDLVFSPAGGGNSVNMTKRRRIGANFVGQWRPSNTLEFTLGLTEYKYDREADTFLGYANKLALAPLPGAPFGFSTIPGHENTVESGAYRDVGFTENSLYQIQKSFTNQIALSGKWAPADDLKLNADFAHTNSAQDQSSGGLRMSNTWNPTGTTLNFNTAGKYPTFDLSGFDFNNKALWNLLDSSHGIGRQDGSSSAARVDLNKSLSNGVISSVDFGLRYASRNISNKSGLLNHTMPTQASGYSLAQTLPEAFGPNPLKGNFYNGLDHMIITNYNWLIPVSLAQNIPKVCAAINNANCYPSFDPFNTYNATEKTKALYGQANYSFMLGSLPVDGNFGLRYVQTDLQISGTRRSNGNTYTPIDQDTKYNDKLPSFNARIELKSDLFLRLAYGKQITRPAFSDLNPNSSYTLGAGSGQQVQGIVGNPDLKPLRSTSFDTSLEYYFTKDSYAYVTAFRKNVSGFIQNIQVTEDISLPEYPNNSSALVSRKINGDNGVINGLEIGIQSFLTFLPSPFDGLGMQANYTRVNSKAPGPVVGTTFPIQYLSKNSYNLVAYYEKNGWRARVAYSYRDDWLDTLQGPGSGSLPIFAAPFGVVDASFGYKFNDHYDFSIDVQNLNQAEDTYYMGVKDRQRFHDVWDRKISAVLKYTF